MRHVVDLRGIRGGILRDVRGVGYQNTQVAVRRMSGAAHDRVTVRPADAAHREFATDVRLDLQRTPRQLQPKYFYDALGSHLFEAICNLPWYGTTRAERQLLERSAAEMVAPVGDLTTIVELGCGSGGKLALLVRGLRRPVLVRLIDISATALEFSERTLGGIPHVSVVGHQATYAAGLEDATRQRPAHGSLMVLFLGSSIGNLAVRAAEAFLDQVRAALRPGDALLLGVDLVKPESELLLAYADPIGVTAAFNKNLLLRINRELDGNFDLGAFAHRAVWNPQASRVESYLVSRCVQEVQIPGAGLTVSLVAGESIWTESSYKYTPDRIVELGAGAGFRCHRQWIEPESRFALSLFFATESPERGKHGVGHQ